MEEIKKLVETWKTEKGSFIPNAPIYGMFIKELQDAIEEQELGFSTNLIKMKSCCENKSIVHTRVKYPNGLPITTLEVYYCENCDTVDDVTW